MPTNWDDLKIEDATDEEFAAMPTKRPGKGSDPRLIEILDAAERGEKKKVTAPDDSQMRGLRVALGRLAAQRGFRLEYRSEGAVMIVTKSDEPLQPKAAAAPSGKKRGRPRKQAEAQDASLQAGMSEAME